MVYLAMVRFIVTPLQIALTNKLVRDFCLPGLVLVFNCLVSCLHEVLFPRMFQVGVSATIPSAIFIGISAFSEAGRLAGMLKAADAATWNESLAGMLASALGALMSDAWYRTLLCPQVYTRLRRICGLADAVVSAETDLWLRSRLVCSWLPVYNTVVVLIIAAVAGAPWVWNPRLWTGFFAFFLVGVVSDAIVISLHTTGGGFQTIRATWSLLLQPRHHWSWSVVQAAPHLAHDQHDDCSVVFYAKRSALSWASDRRLACLPLHFAVASVVYETMVVFFGTCYLWEHSAAPSCS